MSESTSSNNRNEDLLQSIQDRLDSGDVDSTLVKYYCDSIYILRALCSEIPKEAGIQSSPNEANEIIHARSNIIFGEPIVDADAADE
ncbi:hypothetical protein VE03_10562, partial [Pseudogymnoascus sp. 23342-1-I1]